VNHHLETCFLGRATAEDIAQCIKKVLDNANLSLRKLLMLGSNGPNVSKKSISNN
jgi:hypothetical protein